MSCSIRVYTVKNLPLTSAEKQQINRAMVSAVQEETGFNPDTQMEVWWLPPMEAQDCFNTIPFNAEIIINVEESDADTNWGTITKMISKKIFEAIIGTQLLPIKIKPGIFTHVPMYSAFYMGPRPPQQTSSST